MVVPRARGLVGHGSGVSTACEVLLGGSFEVENGVWGLGLKMRVLRNGVLDGLLRVFCTVVAQGFIYTVVVCHLSSRAREKKDK